MCVCIFYKSILIFILNSVYSCICEQREYLDKVQHEQEEEEEEEEEEQEQQQEDAAHNHRLREVVNELKEHSAAAAATIDVAEQEPEIMGTPYDTTTGSAVPLPGSDEETMR
jgi:carbonic anhydrase